MVELTLIDIIQLLAVVAIAFCLGASIDFGYKGRKVCYMLFWLFLIIADICIIVK